MSAEDDGNVVFSIGEMTGKFPFVEGSQEMR